MGGPLESRRTMRGQRVLDRLGVTVSGSVELTSQHGNWIDYEHGREQIQRVDERSAEATSNQTDQRALLSFRMSMRKHPGL